MPKEERGFTYKSRGREALKERANMKGGNFDSIFKPQFKQWKPKEGKNRIRILPPTWKGAKHYGLDIYVNYSIGPDRQSYLSLSKHGKGDDPIAEARREAQRDGDKEYAKALNYSQRILYWIIDRMDEDEGPLLWSAPFTFDKSLVNLCIDEDTKDVIEIDNPEEGNDVRFYREGTMLNTTYDASKIKILPTSPIHEDEGQQDEWLAFVQENPLPDVLNFYSYEHIKAQFDAQAPSKDEDDDEADEEPKARRTKPRDDDDDEAADEKPQRRAASRKPADDDDDDADEKDEKPARTRQRLKPEPEADEEDEPAPRRARAKPKAEEPEDEPEDEDPPPRSRRGKSEPEEDDDAGGRRPSLREKLAARRKRPADEDDD